MFSVNLFLIILILLFLIWYHALLESMINVGVPKCWRAPRWRMIAVSRERTGIMMWYKKPGSLHENATWGIKFPYDRL